MPICFQTELAINTHGAVVDTQNIVSDIHRTIVERREGIEDRIVSVSTIVIHLSLSESSPLPRSEPGLQFRLPSYPVPYI
jgi:hypothetical protein